MPLLVERKLFKIGEGGFAVTLPKAWINYHNLKPGDKVEVIVDDDLTIRIKKTSNGTKLNCIPGPSEIDESLTTPPLSGTLSLPTKELEL